MFLKNGRQIFFAEGLDRNPVGTARRANHLMQDEREQGVWLILEREARRRAAAACAPAGSQRLAEEGSMPWPRLYHSAQIQSGDRLAADVRYFEDRIPNVGTNLSETFREELPPRRTAFVCLRPRQVQVMGPFVGKCLEQRVGLLNVLVSLGRSFGTAPRNDQFVNCEARRRRNLDIGAAVVKDDGRFRIVNQIVEKAQRLCVRSKRRERLWFACFASFVGREKVHPQAAFGSIARDATAIDDAWHGSKAFFDLLENVEGRRGAVANRDRHVLELGDIDIGGLQRRGRETDAEHRRIGLIGDRADEYAAKAEYAHPGESGHDVADLRDGARESEGAHQGRNQGPSFACVVASLPMMRYFLQQFRRFRAHVTLSACGSGTSLEVPISAVPNGFCSKGAFFGKSVFEGCVCATLQEFGIGCLSDERDRSHGFLSLYS